MLCYSTGSLPDRHTPSQIAEALLPTPFRGVELVITPELLLHEADRSFWLGFRRELETRGFRIRNVHLGAPFLLGPEAHRPGLSSLNPSGRRLRLEAALAAARIAESLGCATLTVTTGLPERAGDLAVQEKLVFRSLAEIAVRKPKSVKISVEQEPEHVIRSTTQLLALCRAFPGEVFANFDVGHAAVAGEDIAGSIRDLGSSLSNIHLEDIKARIHRHLLYGDGDVDFRSLFAALRSIGYQGDLTPDLYPFKNEASRALRASAEFLAGFGHYG
jgi:sugar phosphate isomerase/epimerase